MQRVDIETEISSEGGLFFQINARWPGVSLELPTNATPVRAIAGEDYPDTEERDIVDAYVPVSAGDLEEYRKLKNDKDENVLNSDILGDILLKFKEDIEQEVRVLFLEYTETKQIPKEDMRTMVEIIAENSDIIPKPLQPNLSDAIKSDAEATVGWGFDATPFMAFRSSVEDFLDIAEDYPAPLMGTFTNIGFSRLQEITKTYIEKGVNIFTYDWQGLKPSLEKNHDQIQQLIKHLGKSGQASSQIFYSLNHKKYHPAQNTTFYPAEAIALVGMGFSVIGGTFKSAGGGERPESTKIFDPNEWWYEDLPFSSEVDDYPVNTSIDLSQIAVSGHKKNQARRKLINFEALSYTLKKLRAAIQNGDERTLIEQKGGYTGSVRFAMQSMARAYEDARNPGPGDKEYSNS